MSVGRSVGVARSRTVSPITPQWAQLLAVYRVSGGTCHQPRQTPCDLPLEHPCPWCHLAKRVRLGVLRERGIGAWHQILVSSTLAPLPELPWRVETAFTACGCRMWFWNFPTPPMIGCPAPHTLPQAQIGHVGRLSSYPLHPWGEQGGGVVTWPPVWCGV